MRETWFDPWVGKIRWRRDRLPTAVFLDFPCGSAANLPAMQETWVQSLGWEDPLEKGKATHSTILAWSIPWTAWSVGLQSWAPTFISFHFSQIYAWDLPTVTEPHPCSQVLWSTVNGAYWSWILWPSFGLSTEESRAETLHCLWVLAWPSIHCPRFPKEKNNAK